MRLITLQYCIVFSLATILIISCQSRPDTVVMDQMETAKMQEVPELRLDRPTRAFMALVKYLDSLGYNSDTSRVKKLHNYKELSRGKIILFDSFPFYSIGKENSKILSWNNIAREKTDSIDVSVFLKARSLWAYFYRKVPAQELSVDGVIEQWKFSNESEAKEAVQQLESVYPLPFFNTEPWYAIHREYLFVFHTRASAFSYTQHNFFKRFQQLTVKE
jgi:hypothetical protein